MLHESKRRRQTPLARLKASAVAIALSLRPDPNPPPMVPTPHLHVSLPPATMVKCCPPQPPIWILILVPAAAAGAVGDRRDRHNGVCRTRSLAALAPSGACTRSTPGLGRGPRNGRSTCKVWWRSCSCSGQENLRSWAPASWRALRFWRHRCWGQRCCCRSCSRRHSISAAACRADHWPNVSGLMHASSFRGCHWR